MKSMIPILLVFLTTSLLAEKGYTNADILFVRQSPSRSSAVIGLIPYGTEVDLGNAVTVADGYHWRWAYKVAGYIATEFVSKIPPPLGAKVFNLKSSGSTVYCQSEGSSWSEEITFTSGTFTYTSEGADVNGREKNTISGKYELVFRGIRLTFTSITTEYESLLPMPGIPQSKNSSTTDVQLQRTLVYEPSIHGFLLDMGWPEQSPQYLFRSLSKDGFDLQTAVDTKDCRVVGDDCTKIITGYFCKR